MARDFFPRRDAEVGQWTGHFAAKIQEDFLALGLTEAQCDAYVEVQQAFHVAVLRVNSHATNSTAAVVKKNTLRVELESQTRLLARIIRANPNVDSATRVELGLSVSEDGRVGGRGSRAPVPTWAPDLYARAVEGSTVTLRLRDREAPDNKGKPRSCAGAAIFAYIGEEPPSESSQWVFCRNTTRTTADVTFREYLPPGTKVWFSACWFNTRAENGPQSFAIYTHLGFASTPPGAMMRRAA